MSTGHDGGGDRARSGRGGEQGSRTPAEVAALAEAPTLAPQPGAGDEAGVVGAPASGAVKNGAKRIGRYTIRRLIGEGGMGAVYEAEQDNPRRIVALKVMRDGVGAGQSARRFEYEAQLLARLRHPGIAQIYEAGTHQAGAVGGGAIPYYAMEYIAGARPLTGYAIAAALGTRQKLELFAKVCDAVHHGHVKGVIHRDLKPANILVDMTGEPKVIDFGVARAAEADFSTPTMNTQPGVMVGTPQYMSPEQVAGDADIDTRSDVYALGVVLYELLSGELPYDVRTSSRGELTRVIREQPARRLSIATRSEVRGDAETIVHKCLEKDRERRYQSAADLAADLRRYLNNEPIAARPPSVAYQLRVMARRHRALTGAVVVSVVALAGAVMVSTGFAMKAERQRDEAMVARDSARQAKEEAERLRDDAQAAAAKSRRVTEFLGDMLASADPHNAKSKDMTVRELADVAAGRIGEVFKDDADVAGELRVKLGKAYFHLGDLVKARAMFELAHEGWAASLGENNPDTLNALALTGAAVMVQGKPEEAAGIFRDALERQSRVVGEEHPDVLSTLANLAMAEQDLGHLDEAEKLQKRALEIKTRVMGPAHSETIASQMALADLLQSQGKIDEAVGLARGCAESCERILGARHPSTLLAQSIHASAMYDAGRYEEAAPYLKKVYETRVDVLGAEHPDSLTTLNTMALNEEALGRNDAAEELMRKLVKAAAAGMGEEHPTTLTYASNLGNFLGKRAGAMKEEDARRAAVLDEAEGILRRTLATRERVSGKESTATLSVLNNLAMTIEHRGRFIEAEPMYREVVAGVDAALPADHWMRFAARNHLGNCLVDLGRVDEAEPMLRQAYEDLKRVLGEEHQRTRGGARSMERLCEKTGRADEAKRWAGLAKAK